MRIYKDIEYKSNLTLELHLPEENDFSIFVFFHGGGLEFGSSAGCEVFSRTLCKHGIGVATVNYRMYPEAKFPDYIEDCAEAVAWVFQNIGKYGNCKEVYAGGSSAGGYISMMLQFDKKYLQKHGIAPTDLAGYIHDAGQPTTHFKVLEAERGISNGVRVIVDEAAPLYFIGDTESYSPMLIIVSDDDMKNRYEQTQLLISTLKYCGHTENVYYKEMHGTHCAYTYKEDEDGEGVFGKLIAEFIGEVKKE